MAGLRVPRDDKGPRDEQRLEAMSTSRPKEMREGCGISEPGEKAVALRKGPHLWP